MVDSSRRSFFKRAAAAVGVVAAAGTTGKLIARTVESSGDANGNYAADVAAQAKAVKGNQLVVMTDEEKQQRLDDLLQCHYEETA